MSDPKEYINSEEFIIGYDIGRCSVCSFDLEINLMVYDLFPKIQ